MSFVTNYTNEDLKNFEKINTFKNGPFKIDEWIEYTKKNKGKINEQFLDKRLILIKYPRLVDITEEVIQYKKDDKTYVYDIKYSVKTLQSKGISERRKLKPFGQAAISNKNVTSVGEEVNIEYLNSESWRNKKYEKNKEEITNVDKTHVSSNKFKLFKPSNRVIKKKENMESSYKPPEARVLSSRPKSYSLVIKNIPKDMDVNDARNELIHIFSECGFDSTIHENIQSVCKVNVLTNSDNKIKGLAFIDFNDEITYNKILNSNNKFKLGYNVVYLEKKKSKH